MKTKKTTSPLQQIRINPQELDRHQPLARFMISLFNLFEDEIISKLTNTNFKDLTRTDLNTLRYIGFGGETVSQLSKYAGISKQAMSKQIVNLSRRGYVKATQDKNDARIFRISFSKKGAELVSSLIEIIREIEHRYESKIGKTALEKMKQDLQLLISLYSNSKL